MKSKYIFLIVILFFSCRLVNQIEKNIKEATETQKEQGTDLKEKTRDPEQELADEIVAAMDYDNSITRDFALKLARKYPGEPNVGQLCQIYKFIRNNWSYVSDPSGAEYFAKASESINTMAGDCDDFAVVMATCLKSIGFNTRIILAYGNKGGHAYSEVYLTNDKKDLDALLQSINYYYSNIFEKMFGVTKIKSLHYHVDSEGGIWLNLDYSSQYPGGEFFKANKLVIVYPNGTYEISKD